MKVLASQKQLENKYKASQTTADDWYRRAKLALEKGDEVLAREALKRRKDYEVFIIFSFVESIGILTSLEGIFCERPKIISGTFILRWQLKHMLV